MHYTTGLILAALATPPTLALPSLNTRRPAAGLDNATASPAPATKHCLRASDDYGIHINNTSPYTVYLSADWAAKDYPLDTTDVDAALTDDDATLSPSVATFIRGAANTSPKIYLSFTPNSPSVGPKRDHDTVIEVTWSGAGGLTYFDVDIEKGFSCPVWCRGYGVENTTGSGCISDVFNNCPEKYRHYDDQGKVDQCWADEMDPDSVSRFREHCPHTYADWDDTGTQTLKYGAVLDCYVFDPEDPAPVDIWVYEYDDIYTHVLGPDVPYNPDRPVNELGHGSHFLTSDRRKAFNGTK